MAKPAGSTRTPGRLSWEVLTDPNPSCHRNVGDVLVGLAVLRFWA